MKSVKPRQNIENEIILWHFCAHCGYFNPTIGKKNQQFLLSTSWILIIELILYLEELYGRR